MEVGEKEVASAPNLILAREIAANHAQTTSQRRAILSGKWDNHSIVRSALAALNTSQAKIERLETPEQLLANDILTELVRARTKFPGKNVTFAALVEEVGELATATFEESAERVRKEAVQVAVMAMRMVLDGDHCFDAWRSEKSLDPLDPEARADLSEESK